MNINGRNVDIDLAIHSVALEYAKMEMHKALAEDINLQNKPQLCLDLMYSEYLRAAGYLSQKGDDYVTALLGSY